MRIHSKFKDYYDSVMAHGVDETFHWVRNTTEMELDSHPFLNSDIVDNHTALPSAFNAHYEYIGFCGKIYPAILYRITSIHAPPITGTMFDAEQVHKLVASMKDKTLSKAYETSGNISGWWCSESTFTRKGVTNYFNEFSGYESNDLFLEYNTPIFVVEKNKMCDFGRKHLININPILADYNFQHVVDPYTAYQELDMYLSGFLGNGNPEPTKIDDKYMIASKGFDKWSFRKLPSKKK